MNFGLAPLNTRRDIAMLGVIHRAVLCQGPSQLQDFFIEESVPMRSMSRRPRHDRQLQDLSGPLRRDYLNRSLLGYVWIYNWLPEKIVTSSSVQKFQSRCQAFLKSCVSSGMIISIYDIVL